MRIVQLLLLGMALMQANAAVAGSDTVSGSVDFGFVFSTSAHTYLYSTRPALDQQDVIDLQYPEGAENGRPMCCLQLTSFELASSLVSEGPVVDLRQGRTIFRYEVHHTHAPRVKRPFIGLAIVHPADAKVVPDGPQSVRIHVSGRAIDATGCLSTEGMHLFAKDKAALTAHLYFGFEYEVEPTCRPSIFELH